MGRMVKNRKVKGPKTCRCFKKCCSSLQKRAARCESAAKLSCKKLREVWGRKREGPWKQTDRIGQLAQKFFWQVRPESVLSGFHDRAITVFVGQ